MEEHRIWLRRAPIADTASMLRSAVRLLIRHWPTLLMIGLLGTGAQSLLMTAAIRCARFNNLLGVLVLILVPMALLATMVLMLRILRSSLPSLSGPAGEDRRRALDVVGSVLIPFFAVYQSTGDMHRDLYDYVYAVLRVDPFDGTGVPDRLGTLVTIVAVVAIGLRTALGHWSWAERRPWVGIIRAYLEAIWIAIVVSVIAWMWGWLGERRFVQWGTDGVHRVERLGEPVHRVVDWLGSLISAADLVIALPVAWLTVAAIVYGREITDGPLARNPKLTRAVARRWVRLPRIVRRIIDSIRDSFRDRFGPLLMGLRVVVRTGLIPMLLFCLLFLIVRATSVWLFEVERDVIGPHDLHQFWMPLSDPLSALNGVVGTVLLSCLVGAAVDRVLSRQNAPGVVIPAQRTPDWDADTVVVDILDAVQESVGEAAPGDLSLATSLHGKTDIFGQL